MGCKMNALEPIVCEWRKNVNFTFQKTISQLASKVK